MCLIRGVFFGGMWFFRLGYGYFEDAFFFVLDLTLGRREGVGGRVGLENTVGVREFGS